ncbi:hypothetical protein F5880DRAFT_1619306 [Lentinula raphanica]|nr:hypothetical protein F5880DRAFT_1619306 [Lentinula raphanica]
MFLMLSFKFEGINSFTSLSQLSHNHLDISSGGQDSKTRTSSRFWHLQKLMVGNDNAKSKRESEKLSKNMNDKAGKRTRYVRAFCSGAQTLITLLIPSVGAGSIGNITEKWLFGIAILEGRGQ